DLTNVLVQLEPAPVVARVRLTLAPLRGRAWAEAGIDAAPFLARADEAIAPPADDVDPGPHERDGLLVTFWRFVDHDPSRADPRLAGRSLRELATPSPRRLVSCRRATDSTRCGDSSTTRSCARLPTAWLRSEADRSTETPTSGTSSGLPLDLSGPTWRTSASVRGNTTSPASAS